MKFDVHVVNVSSIHMVSMIENIAAMTAMFRIDFGLIAIRESRLSEKSQNDD